MSIDVKQIVDALAPWQAAYSNSKLLSGSVMGAHLVALLFGGGFAVAADRATLRVFGSFADNDQRVSDHLRELHDVHRPVLVALTVMFITGLMLAAADAETFLRSPLFWIKLGLVALLTLNGGVLVFFEARLRRSAHRAPAATRASCRILQLSAWSSLALWTATLLAGVALTNAA